MRLRNYTLYALLYAISLLPLGLLYLVSDVLSWFAYHVLGYRKHIVLSNLQIAFPEKTEKERKKIAKKFYSNLTDTIVESIKLIRSSPALEKKMFQGDLSAFDHLVKTGKNIQIHAMHNFNWEVVNLGVALQMPIPFIGVYQPLLDPFFESLMKKVRSRNGTILIPANDFKNNFQKNIFPQYAIALVADQNPGVPSKAHWANFFGKPAPFPVGPEKAARERDNIVVFAHFFKMRRGVYTFDVGEQIINPLALKEGELTLRYIRYVEQSVRENPDNYLWSHRRWKHAYNSAYEHLAIEELNTKK